MKIFDIISTINRVITIERLNKGIECSDFFIVSDVVTKKIGGYKEVETIIQIKSSESINTVVLEKQVSNEDIETIKNTVHNKAVESLLKVFRFDVTRSFDKFVDGTYKKY